MTDHDSLDLNGDGSEGEPGQQWTQVGRPINSRNNQRRKAKPSSPKEACYANGVHETVMRHRSFRGGKCFIVPQCKPDGGPAGTARNRNLDINEVTNGHVSQTGSERLATSVSKLTISTRTDSTVNSTVSSPSPSIASETQNSSEFTDDKPSYRAHGRYQRNRKLVQHSSFDVDDQSSRNSAQFRQTSPLPNSSSATNLCNPPARSSVGRMVRSPTSPSGATVTQVATFPGEPWRHSNPGWRRSHHSMPFSGRGTVPYHRPSANYQHAPRPFYGATPRYRPPAPPVALEMSPVDSLKEAAPAPVKSPAIPAVSATAVAELQSTNSEKRTSWAATSLPHFDENQRGIIDYKVKNCLLVIKMLNLFTCRVEYAVSNQGIHRSIRGSTCSSTPTVRVVIRIAIYRKEDVVSVIPGSGRRIEQEEYPIPPL
ncbi:hypothetical protein X801_03097, partial [Opisthorchis viverrini]